MSTERSNRVRAHHATGAGPRIGYLRALGRFFKDKDASTVGKLSVLFALAYVVWPIDLVPDIAPILGWLDDLGVVGIVSAYLMRVAARYREESKVLGP